MGGGGAFDEGRRRMASREDVTCRFRSEGIREGRKGQEEVGGAVEGGGREEWGKDDGDGD